MTIQPYLAIFLMVKALLKSAIGSETIINVSSSGVSINDIKKKLISAM